MPKRLNKQKQRFKDTYPNIFKAKYTNWSMKQLTPSEKLWDFASGLVRDALKWISTMDKHPEDYSTQDYIFKYLEAMPLIAIRENLNTCYSDTIIRKLYNDIICNPIEFIEIADKTEYPWFNMKKHSHGPVGRILVGISDGSIKIKIDPEESHEKTA